MGKINYLFKNRLDSKNYYSEERKSSKFRSLYGFKDEIKELTIDSTENFDCVIAESIILDIDNKEDVESALSDTHKIVEYLSKTYNAKVNIYFSGLAGFHIEIPLSEPVELSFNDNNVNAYALLQEEILKEVTIKSSLDDRLTQATRLISLHHKRKKYEKGRTYKISIGVCKDLDKIREYGKKNKDITDPESYENSKFVEHLKDLNKKDVPSTLKTSNDKKNKSKMSKSKNPSSKSKRTKESNKLTDKDKKIFIEIYDALRESNCRHDIKFIMGSSLNGYLNESQANEVFNFLADKTDITGSTNAYNTFMKGFNEDGMPNNLGRVYQSLGEDNIKLFNEFKNTLEKLSEDKYNSFEEITNEYYENIERVTTHYNAFKELLAEYDNDIESLFDDKLITYRNNSKPLFKGMIYSLSSSFGWSSQIVNINAPSGSGKTEYVKTLDSMMPNFLMEGGGTAKSLYREDDYYFNLKSTYLGDWGLITDDEEKEAIIKIFRELMTDNVAKHRITAPNNQDRITFVLKADALSLFITELYTKKYQFGLGEQLVNKSQNININDLSNNDIIDICFLREIGENDDDFRLMHKDYVVYLLNNSQTIPLNKEIIRELFDSDMRALQMDIVYYKVFCIYFDYNPNDIGNVEKYREYFGIKKLSKIEQEWLKLIENNFEPVSRDDIDLELPHKNIINSTTTKDQEFQYFTVKRLKTYLNMRIKNNKTLKESVDYLTDVLNVLLKKGYIGYTFEEDFGKERIYYLTSEDYYEED